MHRVVLIILNRRQNYHAKPMNEKNQNLGIYAKLKTSTQLDFQFLMI